MKLLKGLLYFILGLAALVAIMGLFARKKYYIERSIEIEAPLEVVFEQIRLTKNYEKWSPWHDLDLNMKTSLEGEDGTVGSIYRWDGNADAGKGSQRITAIRPDRIDLEVTLLDPWKSTSPRPWKTKPQIRANWASTWSSASLGTAWPCLPMCKPGWAKTTNGGWAT